MTLTVKVSVNVQNLCCDLTLAAFTSDGLDNVELQEIVKEVTFVDTMLKAAIKEITKEGGAPEHKIGPWGKPWSRKIKLTVIPKNPLMRTVTMINHHTAPWAPISGNSESRVRKETICSAIAEHCIVTEYRLPLLMNQKSASAFTRANLEVALSLHTDTNKARHVKDDDEPSLERHIIHWSDEIEIDTMKAQALKFDCIEENKRNVRITSRKKDYDSIKKVIAALHSCSFAWPPRPDSTVSFSRPRSVRPDIETPLGEIVTLSTRLHLSLTNTHADIAHMYIQETYRERVPAPRTSLLLPRRNRPQQHDETRQVHFRVQTSKDL